MTTIIPPPPTQPLSSDRARYMTGFMSSMRPSMASTHGTETIGQSADPSSGIWRLVRLGAAIRPQSCAMVVEVREKPAESIPPVITRIDAAKLVSRGCDDAISTKNPLPKQMSIPAC